MVHRIPLHKSVLIILWFILMGASILRSQVLEVGPGKPFAQINQAAAVAQPGDTILVAPGTYPGGMFIANLQGAPGQWITLRGDGPDPVTIQGGGNAIQFSDPAWLVIEGFRFRQQTGNGLNIDDGGTYETPAQHVHIRQCVFEDMAVSGNNDLLKLSGLDSFLIEDCHFRNGAAGGSGIDMVGCHWGTIRYNRFENLGSNSIQAKGGTRYIAMHGNQFRNGGQRTLNLGGSTGAAFFRPPGANYEAADLDVYANLFEGSWAPIAYVGSQRVRVWNNTIYRPQNWVIRILQESADTSFYQAVADGEFINNIVVVGSSLSTTANVGPNTNAASFTFAHNLWLHEQNPNWPGPFLPAPQTAGLIQVDPLFQNPAAGDFRLMPPSPAIGYGRVLAETTWEDADGKVFLDPPSLGAYEGGISSHTTSLKDSPEFRVFPQPARPGRMLTYEGPPFDRAELCDLHGRQVAQWTGSSPLMTLPEITEGPYSLRVQYADGGFGILLIMVSR